MVQIYYWFKFYYLFILLIYFKFLGMVMFDNEFETMKDKI